MATLSPRAVLQYGGCMKRYASILLAPALLAGCATTQPPAAREYVALFNEPFLNFESRGNDLLLTSPEDLDGTLLPANRSMAGGAIRFDWTDGGGNGFQLNIEPGQCFDSMAGLEYSHRAFYTGGSYTRLEGCARLTSEAQPQEGA